MILRKINAVISLLTTVLFMQHAIFLSIWMLSRCSIERSVYCLPWILTVLMVAHALLSSAFGFIGHKGAEKRKCKSYPQMNIPTYLQRATGILLLLLMGLHIFGAFNHFHPKMLHAVAQPLFFVLSLAHVAVSLDKAFITLGIGNAKTVKIIGVATKFICALIFVAGTAGFFLCLIAGVAR